MGWLAKVTDCNLIHNKTINHASFPRLPLQGLPTSAGEFNTSHFEETMQERFEKWIQDNQSSLVMQRFNVAAAGFYLFP